MTVQLEVPDDVRQTVDAIVSAARTAFGEALVAVVLYGSAAEGRLRASSDVNLLFALSRFDPDQANAFREAYRFAHAAIDLTAMFVLTTELRAAEDAFAQKFADIRRRHVVLYGEDLFAETEISRDALVRRLQQTLLNLAMRSRLLYIERSLREEQCAATVAELAGPLRTSAASILELERGATVPPKEALAELVRNLGRPDLEPLLPHLSVAREQRVLPAGSAAPIFLQAVELARALYERSLRLR